MMRPAHIKQKSFFGEPSIGTWESDRHYAAAFRDRTATRLDICRKDLSDGITWDELQQIKNECGFEHQDAVEFFPAAADVINTGNVRHLYVFDEKLPLVRRAA